MRCPIRRPFCLSVAPILPDARALLDAVNAFGIRRDIATRNPRCGSAHTFVHAHAHSNRTPDAPTKNSLGAMARVKASLLPSALRGLDPRHALPDLGHLS